MSVHVTTGQWMVSTPGTPGAPTQHFIPPTADTRAYALSHAYVAPCATRALCIPASAEYRNGIPYCPLCERLPLTRL
jgi:hypothetical protein